MATRYEALSVTQRTSKNNVEGEPVLSKRELKKRAKEDAKRSAEAAKQVAVQEKLDAKQAEIRAKEDAKKAKLQAKQDKIDEAERAKRKKRNSIAQAKQNAIDKKARKAEEKAAKKRGSLPQADKSSDIATASKTSLLTAQNIEEKLTAPRSSTRFSTVPSVSTTVALENSYHARSGLMKEVKDLTLTISGMYDELQRKRSAVLGLELKNADFVKESTFHGNAYRTLRKDLSHVQRDFQKADVDYLKGKGKVTEQQYYLKKNMKLKRNIVERNIDLLAEMTVNDEVIPDVCRELSLFRLKEQGKSLRQLRSRLASKTQQLEAVEASIKHEEQHSDQVCVLSEGLQHKLDDQGYEQHESYNVAQLRSIAYCLGYVQYQIDDLTREIDFTREMNVSRINQFNNELNWRTEMTRDKVQTLQTTVARILHPKLGTALDKTTERVTTVSSCVPRVIPEAQKEWMTSQIDLSEVQKRIIEAEFELLFVEVVYRSARLYGKLLALRQRLRFTLAKREQFLTESGCLAQTSEKIYL